VIRRICSAVGMALLVAVLSLATAGASFAFWRIGSGSGSASSSTTMPITLSVAPVSGLYPGSTATIQVTATNPNTSPVRFGSIVLDKSQGMNGGYSVTAVADASCYATRLSYTTQSNQSGWTVPPASGGVLGTLTITLPAALSLSTDTHDACQGAQFQAYLKVAP